MAGEQVAGYRVDIRYKSGKEESIQARQVEGVAGEVAENPQTERRTLANDPPRSTWLASRRGEATACARYGAYSVARPHKVRFAKSPGKAGFGNDASSPINEAK